jgi:centromeric protein E
VYKCLVQETGQTVDKFGKAVKDVGVDPMFPALEAPSDWPLEFERQQKMILELWKTCNVSLVHRTYFFLLFKGDPTDSIYLGVELRRLSFLKKTFSNGSQAVEDGRTLTQASRFSVSLSASLSPVCIIIFREVAS